MYFLELSFDTLQHNDIVEITTRDLLNKNKGVKKLRFLMSVTSLSLMAVLYTLYMRLYSMYVCLKI